MKYNIKLALALVTFVSVPALAGEAPVGLLIRCNNGTQTAAELSIEKDSQGSRISLWIYEGNPKFIGEYRGSDVSAVRALGAGKAVTVPAETLFEFGRRDTITVEPGRGNIASLTVRSAQHGSMKLSCHYVD